MKTTPIPLAGLEASSIVLGMMRIESLADDELRALVDTALDEGVTVFDHADIYGSTRHGCERRFGEAVTMSSSTRDRVLVQSKVGIRNGFFDFSAEHILRSVDESLEALRLDHLDLLLLHRPDTLVEPEEVAAAFSRLLADGKVRHFGVSNHTPGQIELLRTAVDQPLVVDQVQLSLTHAPLITAGLTANMAAEPASTDRDGGLLDYARREGIGLQAWSPFQKGGADGVFLGARADFSELNVVLDELAAVHGVTPMGIATAWITRHPAGIQVVLGTTNPGRVGEAAAGTDVELSREEWYRLYRAAGHPLP